MAVRAEVLSSHRIAHLPTTAKDGLRTQGLIAERGHAEVAKQILPSPFANEATAGTATSRTRSAPSVAAMRDRRGFALAMDARAYA